jgi:HAMP domain-containing protein
MLRQVHNVLHITRLHVTPSEILLLTVAAGLFCASLAQLVATPLVAAVMLLAVAAIVALVYERWTTRRTMRLLSERLNDDDGLGKREVATSADIAVLDQALNRLIQRTRAQAQAVAMQREDTTSSGSRPVGQAHMVAVLSIGIRQGATEAFTLEHLELLVQAATHAIQGNQNAMLSVQMQGDGTVLVASGAKQPQPIVTSLRQVVAVAKALSADERLRFGLSCGAVRVCALPGVVPVLVGSPIEDALRLFRMATAWHQYQLLCTEPVALLARAYPSERTPLKLNLAVLPSLRVYNVDLESMPVARSA